MAVYLRLLGLILVGWTGSALSGLAKDRAPDWVMALAAPPVIPPPDGAPALVLRHEQRLQVVSQADWTETTRYVVRLHADNSEASASYSTVYVSGGDDVARLSAWLVHADGSVKEFGKADWLDQSLLQSTGLYSDYRMKFIAGGVHVQKGDLFACEVVVQRRQQFGDAYWSPGRELPVQSARMSVELPKGWTAASYLRGAPAEGEPINQVGQGRTAWTWQGLPYQPNEEGAPNEPTAQIELKFRPPPQVVVKGNIPPDEWQALALWAAKIQDASCDQSPLLATTARNLVAGLDTWQAKVEAIARFVQRCPYASVDRNVGLGFGYRPRTATKVVETRWGDCKDKVNLLRALLREIGMVAIPLTVKSGGAPDLRREWPTLMAFDHVIAAIQVPSSRSPAVEISLPGQGTWLLFDPTAEHVPLGELPWNLRNQEGLWCGAGAAGLVRIPSLDETSRWRRRVEGELILGEKEVEGTTATIYHGELANAFRYIVRDLKESELRGNWGEQMNRKLRGTKILDYAHTDNWSQDQVAVKVKWTAKDFGQRMQRLWVLRLDLLAQTSLPEIRDKTRRQSYLASPIVDETRLAVTLPVDYEVENLPADKAIDSEFGEYRLHHEVREGKVEYSRTLHVHGGDFSPERFGAYRKFLLEVAKSDQRALTLRKKADTKISVRATD